MLVVHVTEEFIFIYYHIFRLSIIRILFIKVVYTYNLIQRQAKNQTGGNLYIPQELVNITVSKI